MKNKQNFYSIFKTKIGSCSLSFSDTKLLSFYLPHEDKNFLKSKFKASSLIYLSKDKEPEWVKTLISKVQEHFSGNLQDFKNIPISLESCSDFTKSVYIAAKKIPAGSTCSYSELAKKINNPKSSRAVGTALGKNPFLLIVPCHRVITSAGKLGGFSAFGGIKTKQKILEIEGRNF